MKTRILVLFAALLFGSLGDLIAQSVVLGVQHDPATIPINGRGRIRVIISSSGPVSAGAISLQISVPSAAVSILSNGDQNELNGGNITSNDGSTIHVSLPAISDGDGGWALNIWVQGNASTSGAFLVTTANLDSAPLAGDDPADNSASSSIEVTSATPVDLISFNGKAEGGKAVLDWLTAEETGFSHFIVEKSLDAKAFTAIGEVPAKGSGNSYGFTTDQTEALVYYRLTMVDADGTTAPSKIIPVALDDSQSPAFMVYPNPTADYLQIKYNEGGTVRIVDISGNQIRSQQVESGVSVIDVRDLREGVYYGKFNNQSFKFVKK